MHWPVHKLDKPLAQSECSSEDVSSTCLREDQEDNKGPTGQPVDNGVCTLNAEPDGQRLSVLYCLRNPAKVRACITQYNPLHAHMCPPLIFNTVHTIRLQSV